VCVLDASSSVLKIPGKIRLPATQNYGGYDYSVIVIKFALYHNLIEYRIWQFKILIAALRRVKIT